LRKPDILPFSPGCEPVHTVYSAIKKACRLIRTGNRLGICCLALLGLAVAAPLAEAIDHKPAAALQDQCVVLLHGLGRSAGSMDSMAKSLQAAGFSVINQGYASTEEDIAVLADQAVSAGIEGCRQTGASHIHFVTHSMGGILVRIWLARNPAPEPGRIVMLSPPNHGSEIIDTLGDQTWFQWLMGPASAFLGTGDNSTMQDSDSMPLDVGIITGNFSWDPWFSLLIEGEDDGKVSVESAKLEGMRDFLVVSRGHAFIMRAPEVKQQTLHFLRFGRFKRESAE